VCPAVPESNRQTHARTRNDDGEIQVQSEAAEETGTNFWQIPGNVIILCEYFTCNNNIKSYENEEM
jgi:hypothetical protein